MPVYAGDEDVRKFINEYHITHGNRYTHTSIGNPKVSLSVSDDKYDDFMDDYCKLLLKGKKLNLTEKPKECSHFRVDIDFRFALGSGISSGSPIPRIYTAYDVERIVKHYQVLLKKYLDITDDCLVAYVMEKEHPVEYKGKHKDGIHIVFPEINTNYEFQHFIRHMIIQESAKMFEGLPLTNSFENIVDEAIIDKNNWQMYGSCKPDNQTYLVTKIYKYNDGDLVLQKTPKASEQLEWPKYLSMRNNLTLTPYNSEKKDEIDEFIRVILPTKINRKRDTLHQQVFGNVKNLIKSFIPDDELEIAKRLVKCLNKSRAENYDDWIKLGWTLRNIDYRLLDSWVEFSEVSNKYVSGECEKLWDRMRVDTLGMGTLRYWAKQDNQKEYDKIDEDNVTQLIDKCIGSNGADYDVANVVYTMFKHQYCYTTRDTWYVFREDKHKWECSKDGLQLRKIIYQVICGKFIARANYWNQQAMIYNAEEDSTQNDACQLKSKKCMEISLKLKKAGFNDSIIKVCKVLFTNPKFEELLDSRPNLVGFENGVYDLRLHEFREGLPDDYISLTTGRHYITHDSESQEVREINTFLSQVFTNPEIRQYALNIFTSIIDGGIRHEKFYIFTGSGCHAIDTPIMMFDGSIKKVQEIAIGDKLMGDDNTSRTVKELFRGVDEMYTIRPIKGEPFKVNKNHILSIKFTNLVSIVKRTDGYYKDNPKYSVSWYEYTKNKNIPPIRKSKTFTDYEEAKLYSTSFDTENMVHKGDILDIKVSDLLQWNPWWLKKGNVSLFKSNTVSFEDKKLNIDPYLLGHWLGDGHSCGSVFTTMDTEVVEYYKNTLKNHSIKIYADKGKAKTYGISGNKETKNTFNKTLQENNLINNKHIPQKYKTSSIQQRLELLAGIIDSDGYYCKRSNQYEITLKNNKLMDDIIYIVRSLGLACYKKCIQKTCTNGKKGPVKGTYYRIQVYGEGIENIPCKLKYKKASKREKNKNALLNSFKIEKVEDGKYYGFELDGNHRYLMGDFTVTHNSNGKSMILELIQKAVGDYYCILPISLLTQKRAASNSAQSELERTKGRRYAVMQEPSEGEKINIGLMKELSGGDTILCRGLFKEPVQFKPQFKMIMTCNELPEVPSDDGGTWRRIRVINFSSKFTDNPDPNNPKEFALDTDLGNNFDRWADAFISMLIENHKNHDIKTIKEPMEVRIATESYKKNNDIIGQYISERIVKDEDTTETIMLQAAYTDFKIWVSRNIPKGKRIPDRMQMRSYMENMFGPYPTNKGWKGIRYVVDYENESEQ